jgi:glycosyltransferase involved in cell wall biosynthesis
MVTVSRPTFSIVVPCYNYGPFLTQAIESVLVQARDDVEVIVVDDASTDDSAAIAKSFGPPVRVIELSVNSGPGAAWGVGIGASRGSLLCKLDADDWQLPGFLDRVAREFDRDERVGLVATGVHLYTEGEPTAVLQRLTTTDEVWDEHELRRQLLRKFFVRMPGTCLRRSAIGDHVPRSDLRMGEDWEFFLRVTQGWRCSVVRDPLAVYRIHPASLTVTSHTSSRLKDELERLLKVTRTQGDPGYLGEGERRVFAVGVAESYLGTVGPQLSTTDLSQLLHHLRVAMMLAGSESKSASLSILRYVAWGVWHRLVVRPLRRRRPIADLRVTTDHGPAAPPTAADRLGTTRSVGESDFHL